MKDLDPVRHDGPSTIGVDTLYLSKGNIPEVFLRGCGVPDAFITYSKSLIGSAIEFYSCFISCSTRDQDFADRLYADLQAKGVRCWFATEDLKIGDKFRSRIEESIRLDDKLLLVLSEASSMNRTERLQKPQVQRLLARNPSISVFCSRREPKRCGTKKATVTAIQAQDG